MKCPRCGKKLNYYPKERLYLCQCGYKEKKPIRLFELKEIYKHKVKKTKIVPFL